MSASNPARALLAGVAGPVVVGGWGFVMTGSPSAFGIAFLAAGLGPFVGLLSTAPYFTLAFKLWLALALCACLALAVAGFRFRARFIGLVLLALGSVGWTLTGALGFGPQ